MDFERESRHRDAGYTALYTAYVTSVCCCIPEYKVDLQKLIGLLINDKKHNPSNYSLAILSEGAEWEGYTVREYGEPDAFGHRKKMSVAEDLSTGTPFGDHVPHPWWYGLFSPGIQKACRFQGLFRLYSRRSAAGKRCRSDYSPLPQRPARFRGSSSRFRWPAPVARTHTTATLTLSIGGSESNRQSQCSPPSLPIHN
jgi:hypothetical protein